VYQTLTRLSGEPDKELIGRHLAHLHPQQASDLLADLQTPLPGTGMSAGQALFSRRLTRLFLLAVFAQVSAIVGATVVHSGARNTTGKH
jgi:hypothetical protein